MPKQRAQLSSKAQLIERDFSKFFCILCHTTVNCDERFRVTRRQKSAKHLKALHVAAEPQSFIPATKMDFKAELVDSFLSADIPLRKLQNPKIRGLFTDLGQPVPSESACRGHVETLAASEFERIKNLLTRLSSWLLMKARFPKQGILMFLWVKQRHQRNHMLWTAVWWSLNQAVIAAKVDDTLRKLGVQAEQFPAPSE